MKLLFSKYIFFILSVIFFSYAIVAKEVTSEYKIEIGKIDVGKLFWSIDIDETKYEIFIKLEDWGFFSGLYNFNGSYNTKGRVVNNSLVPSSYKQKWVTKKKKRDVELYFTNGSVSKLNLFPKEIVPPKIEFLAVRNVIDPLSSFLNILKNNTSPRVIDWRRFYNMVVTQENLQHNMIIKYISIVNYLNIWADHNKNDLGSIQFEQIDNDNEFVLPHKVIIKYKGLVFNLNKI